MNWIYKLIYIVKLINDIDLFDNSGDYNKYI